MKQIDIIRNTIEQVERRYNAENDIIPGTPFVTWADHQLLELVHELAGIVEAQQTDIENLYRRIEKMS
jgi:hypothetical protein